MKLDKYIGIVVEELSLPTRECGLKLRNAGNSIGLRPVTPHAGVWIETAYIWTDTWWRRSLPTRECGLKPLSSLRILAVGVSLPTRECGLKPEDVDIAKKISRSLPTRECGLKQWYRNSE